MTAATTINLTNLTMHRGNHLRAASVLGISAEHAHLFYDADKLAFSGDLAGAREQAHSAGQTVLAPVTMNDLLAQSLAGFKVPNSKDILLG